MNLEYKLVLYVDSSWRRQGIHSPLLFPFWGNPTRDVSLFSKEMFDSYPFDTRYYDVVDDIAQSDMVFAPYRHLWMLQHDPALFNECARVAREAGKPLLLDGMGDVERPIGIDNTYVLRIGGYRFIDEPGRIQVPPAADDLLERVCGGQLQVRAKREDKPMVGFAGWAKLTPAQYVRTFIKELPIRLRGLFDNRYRAMQKGVLWRARVLRVLGQSPTIVLNLKKRSSFSGSAKTAQTDMRTLRQELVDTVLGSDYCLDVRGDANDATRLYEVLSLGRIPVIIDTERRLPFSDEVRYKDFCLTVDFRDYKRLPQIIADFHAKVTPEQFELMQRKAREAFVAYFRTDAQMRHIVRELRVISRGSIDLRLS